MSRRFGRNQRRRAREQIAALEIRNGNLRTGLTLSQELAKHQAEKLQELRSVLRDVGDCLGVNFVGLPVQVARNIVLDKDNYDRTFRMLNPLKQPVEMHPMALSAGTDGHHSAMHVRVSMAGGDVAYAVSASALRTAPTHVLARNIASEMATFLVAEIRKAGGR